MAADFSRPPPELRAEAEAAHARMMAALPYERMEIDGASAAAEVQRLQGLGKGWPVVVGDDQQLEAIAEQYSIEDPAVFGPRDWGSGPRSPAEILETASRLSFPDDLAQWDGGLAPEDLVAPVGDWPAQIVVASPSEYNLGVAHDVLQQRPFARVHVLFIPTADSWEVPAFLRWGGWNACPPPEHHVAALRRWHEAYGAELVGISRDFMDVRVPRPPCSREEALAVAREIYAYCPDDVEQGLETLAALAAQMVMQPWWNFWWD